ncbi:MAG: hypothetical protein LBO05_06920 [Deltaproteobacteria bacterium]|jgi:hypothetical protein|nr:hypothetical protein [Deltaproteobacteria bacterium]
MSKLDDLALDIDMAATTAELIKSLEGLSSLWRLVVLRRLPDYPSYEVLATVGKRESVRLDDLLAKLQPGAPDGGNPMGLIHLLVAEGLITKTPVPSDQRRFVVSLTDDGRGRLAGMEDRLFVFFSEILETFPRKDQESLGSLLRRLNEALVAAL